VAERATKLIANARTHGGIADSLDEAKAAFKMAWERR